MAWHRQTGSLSLRNQPKPVQNCTHSTQFLSLLGQITHEAHKSSYRQLEIMYFWFPGYRKWGAATSNQHFFLSLCGFEFDYNSTAAIIRLFLATLFFHDLLAVSCSLLGPQELEKSSFYKCSVAAGNRRQIYRLQRKENRNIESWQVIKRDGVCGVGIM